MKKPTRVANSDFRAKRERSYEEFREAEGVKGRAIPLATLMKHVPPEPDHGDRWGEWEYNNRTFVITHLGAKYDVDLERCATSAQMLDYIFQVAGKAWMTPKDLGDLVQALDDLLSPQGTLCSLTEDKKLDVKKHLLKKAAKKPA
jgi:hypothetical protein